MNNQTNVEQGIITKALGGSVQETKVETPAPPVPEPLMVPAGAEKAASSTSQSVDYEKLEIHRFCQLMPPISSQN